MSRKSAFGKYWEHNRITSESPAEEDFFKERMQKAFNAGRRYERNKGKRKP